MSLCVHYVSVFMCVDVYLFVRVSIYVFICIYKIIKIQSSLVEPQKVITDSPDCFQDLSEATQVGEE